MFLDEPKFVSRFQNVAQKREASSRPLVGFTDKVSSVNLRNIYKDQLAIKNLPLVFKGVWQMATKVATFRTVKILSF